MPLLQFGAGAYDNTSNGLPMVRLENWYAEEAPERPSAQIKLMPTPGLELLTSGLSGAVQGMFQNDGHQSGNIIASAGGTAYSINAAGVSTSLGTIGSDTYGTRFDASDLQLVSVSGGVLSKMDNTAGSFSTFSIPATGTIIDLCHINDKIVYVEGGSGRIWWSDVLAAQTVSATSFATAQSEADSLLACRAKRGDLWLFGTQTIEIWFDTGVSPSAVGSTFAPRPGAVIEKGIMSRRAVTSADFGVFIVGNDGIVYRIDGLSPARISNNSIERDINSLSLTNKDNIRLEQHTWDGHVFVHLSLPGKGVWLYDVSTGLWAKRTSYGKSMYSPVAYVHAFGNIYAGDRLSGNVYRLSNTKFTENGLSVIRVATTGFPIDDGKPAIRSMSLDFVAYGQAAGMTEPSAEICWSDNFRTFGNPITRKLGAIGQTKRVVFGPQGRATMPGREYQLTVSDNIGVSLIGAKINVRRPGGLK